MKAFTKKYDYQETPSIHLDEEVRDLCNAMNALPGISTIESCCGHSSSPFSIWFKVLNNDLSGLFFLTRCVDHRYWKYGYLWNIELSVGDMYNPIMGRPLVFCLTSGPIVGEDAYAQAQDLVKNMNDHLNIENFMKGFDLDIDKFDVEEIKLLI